MGSSGDDGVVGRLVGFGGPGTFVRRRTVAFVVGVAGILLAVLYDRFVLTGYRAIVATWYVKALDWLFLLALLAVCCYGLVPILVDRDKYARQWGQIRSRPVVVAALLYLGCFFVLGVVAPMFVAHPATHYQHSFQPPVFAKTTTSLTWGDCVAPLAGDTCHGTFTYLLGTDKMGRDVLLLTIEGMNVALQVAVITAVIIVPIAVTVGTVAGLYGGTVDRLLMGYVDVQQTVPAILVYFILGFLFGRNLYLFVLVFGLLNWGSVARPIRSDVFRFRDVLFVDAAESVGVSRLGIVRRHIVPNVSSTVVTGLSQQVPVILLTQAAISYLEMNDLNRVTWGELIADGGAWWVSAVPAAALFLTVVSITVVGDAVRDAFDVYT